MGEVTHRGETKKAYLSMDNEHQYLTLVIIGPTGQGSRILLAILWQML